MFGMFSFLQHKKAAQKVRDLHGMAIRYVTERRDDNDDVVGRGGSLSVRDDQLLVFSSGDIIFRAPVAEVKASDLLSGDGVVIEGPDMTQGGRARRIIAYYVYHRK